MSGRSEGVIALLALPVHWQVPLGSSAGAGAAGAAVLCLGLLLRPLRTRSRA